MIRNTKKFRGYCLVKRFCYECQLVIDVIGKVLEVSISSRAKGSLIRVRGELPLESLNLLKKSQILKIPLEKLKSISKYRVSKKDINVFKCLEDEDIQRNLAVVEIIYDDEEIRLLINDNEASKLNKIFSEWLATQ